MIKHRLIRGGAVLIIIGFIHTAALGFTLEQFHFDSAQQETTFRELIGKLRCLVCQNESLAGSQAELAQDLRREVYEMLRAGKSEQEVISFLTTRYGDFILYDPPLKPSTYVLWFGPIILISIAAVFMLRLLLRGRSPLNRNDALDPQEQQRLNQLLAATIADPNNPTASSTIAEKSHP
ncbi:cytochrome c-type biogenesis protein [Thiospirillum jenense]|uniref:Cytochrome c-type biogenesis protein n=1 Tax=Thiospirillum jenense TaxID=1653858 RepID=A0A839HHW4_9GAMM|nr:cytochrome c-type biogenesis protein [Thiospirillum jenense]MBB1126726.1 cytochrome c-type biogenesis protein CcmH [Thiospirillum jenense]